MALPLVILLFLQRMHFLFTPLSSWRTLCILQDLAPRFSSTIIVSKPYVNVSSASWAMYLCLFLSFRFHLLRFSMGFFPFFDKSQSLSSGSSLCLEIPSLPPYLLFIQLAHSLFSSQLKCNLCREAVLPILALCKPLRRVTGHRKHNIHISHYMSCFCQVETGHNWQIQIKDECDGEGVWDRKMRAVGHLLLGIQNNIVYYLHIYIFIIYIYGKSKSYLEYLLFCLML